MDEPAIWRNVQLENLDFENLSRSDSATEAVPLQQASSTLDPAFETAQKAFREMHERMSSLALQVEDLTSKYQSAQRDMASSDKSLVRLSQQLHEKDKSIALLNSKIQDLTARKDQTEFELGQEIEEKSVALLGLNDEVASLKGELSEARGRVESSRSELESYRNQLASAFHQMDVEKEQLEKLLAHLTDKVSRLTEESDEQKSEMERAHEEINSLLLENESLKQDKGGIFDQIENLKAKVQSEEEARVDLQGHYNRLKSSHNTLEASFQKILIDLESRDMKIATAEEHIRNLGEELSTARKAAQEVQAQREREVNLLRSKVQDLRQRALEELQALRAERDREVENLESKVRDLTSRARDQQDQMKSEAGKRIAEIEVQLHEVRGQKEALERSQQVAAVQMAQLVQDRDQMEAELKRFAQESAEKQTQISKLERELIESTAQTSSLEGLKQTIASLREDLTRALNSRDELQENLEVKVRELKQRVRELEEIDVARSQAEEKAEHLHRELERSQQVSSDQREELRQLNSKLGETLIAVRRDKALIEKQSLVQREKDSIISALTDDLSKEKGRAQHLEGALRELENTLSKVHKEQEGSMTALQAEHESTILSVRKEYERSIAEAHSSLTTLRNKRARVAQQALRLRSELRWIRALSEERLAESERRRQEIEQVKVDLQDASFKALKAEEMAMDLEKRDAELKVALQELTELRQRAQRSEELIEKARLDGERTKEREGKINTYLRAVDEEKGKLRHFCVKVLRGLQSSRSINPMTHFLAATEKEISRVEIYLSKLPPLSSDRGRLEGEYEKLIEQREFLKRLMEEHDRETSAKLAEFMALTGSEELVPMPPPPPQDSPMG